MIKNNKLYSTINYSLWINVNNIMYIYVIFVLK